MATITITIPNALLNRVTDGYAYQYGYQDEIPAIGTDRKDTKIPNPETRQQFVRRMLVRHIKQAVQQYEIRLAEESARQVALDKAENEVTLTVS